MPVNPPAKYSEIRSQLQTGDLLAFEGSQPLDYMINLLEEGIYSHVGMVLRDESGNLWFWDAPGGGITFPDPYWTKPGQNTGCRVANLDNLLAYYMSDMGIQTFTWRHLTPSIPYTPGSTLDTFLATMDGTPFPGTNCSFPPALVYLVDKYFGSKNLPGLELGIGLLLTYLTGVVLLVETVNFVFCAQLAALTYMNAGLLPSAPLPANGYTPAEFMDQPVPLQLLGGASLTAPITVQWDGPTQALHGAEGTVRTPVEAVVPALLAAKG